MKYWSRGDLAKGLVVSGKALTLSGVSVWVNVLISRTCARSAALLMDLLMNAEWFRGLMFQQRLKHLSKLAMKAVLTALAANMD